MELSRKSPQLAAFLESISGRTTAIENDRCINPPLGCGQPIDPSTMSELELREYRISGICANCQPNFFGAND